MLGDVPGKPGDLFCQRPQGLPERGFRLLLELRKGLQLLLQAPCRTVLRQLGELLQLSQGEFQDLTDFPDCRTKAVGGEGADQTGVLASVFLVDGQDEGFPDVPGEVQVDVRHRVKGLVQETP